MLTLISVKSRSVLLTATTALASSALLPITAVGQHLDPAEAPMAASAGGALLSEAEIVGDPLNAPMPEALEALVLDDVIEQELGDDLAPAVVLAAREAYAQNLFRPLWTRDSADALVAEWRNLFEYGLSSDETVDEALTTIVSRRFGEGDVEDRARADIELSAAFLRMASAVSGGLSDEGEAERSRDDRPSQSVLTASLLDAAEGRVASQLHEFEPEHPQYRRLKEALEEYRQIKAQGGWLAIPSGDVLEPGKYDPRVPALRIRLEAEGYLARNPENSLINAIAEAVDLRGDNPDGDIDEAADSPPEETLFDEALAAALHEFQRRHGIEPDGVLGPNTLEALNESVESKIDRIADSMARWRHLGDLGERYIWANIPSFTAEAWDDGRVELSMRTIVGMPSRETPIFSDEIEYMVANPSWYAPVSILRRDKAPILAEDPDYARRGNYQVFDNETGEQVNPAWVDWTNSESATRYRLIQQPGPGNALGEMKIMFPNQYSVYLHGTPNQALFDEAQRTFSSGCIRLEDPEAMARWLAREDGWDTLAEVAEAIEGEETESVVLAETTPVHITYVTVTVGEESEPMFWRDVYGRDDGLEYVERLAPLYAEEEEDLAANVETP